MKLVRRKILLCNGQKKMNYGKKWKIGRLTVDECEEGAASLESHHTARPGVC